MKWLVILALMAAGLMAYVRLSPLDAARWHVALSGRADEKLQGGILRNVAGDAALFAQLDAVIRATPRTAVLAGDVGAGHITYVTRSLFWGFPDMTTVHAQGGQIRIFARLRFGMSDLGVNAARVTRWLAAVGR